MVMAVVVMMVMRLGKRRTGKQQQEARQPRSFLMAKCSTKCTPDDGQPRKAGTKTGTGQ